MKIDKNSYRLFNNISTVDFSFSSFSHSYAQKGSGMKTKVNNNNGLGTSKEYFSVIFKSLKIFEPFPERFFSSIFFL